MKEFIITNLTKLYARISLYEKNAFHPYCLSDDFMINVDVSTL